MRCGEGARRAREGASRASRQDPDESAAHSRLRQDADESDAQDRSVRTLTTGACPPSHACVLTPPTQRASLHQSQRARAHEPAGCASRSLSALRLSRPGDSQPGHSQCGVTLKPRQPSSRGDPRQGFAGACGNSNRSSRNGSLTARDVTSNTMVSRLCALKAGQLGRPAAFGVP